jgi:ribonuclease P protein component
MSLSFPKQRRLSRPAEFERVRREGSSQRGRFMMVSILRVEKSGPFRAGFVTTRRLGGAVSRNLVRRRLREIVRHHQDQIRDDVWIIVIAKTEAARASYLALEDEYLRLIKRASILAA